MNHIPNVLLSNAHPSVITRHLKEQNLQNEAKPKFKLMKDELNKDVFSVTQRSRPHKTAQSPRCRATIYMQ
jgi:hypothetical protein